MKPRIYIETSVVSYLTARPSQNIITAAQQIITRQWWTTAAAYDLCTSQLTLDEATNGDAEAASQRLSVLGTLPILTLDEDAKRLGERLVHQLAIPSKALDDAYHVAIAAVNGVDYLATWNCKHIANARTRAQIEAVCRAAGFQPAVIGTPQELFLLGES
jgi:predicted nucleic acid-binding protein